MAQQAPNNPAPSTSFPIDDLPAELRVLYVYDKILPLRVLDIFAYTQHQNAPLTLFPAGFTSSHSNPGSPAPRIQIDQVWTPLQDPIPLLSSGPAILPELTSILRLLPLSIDLAGNGGHGRGSPSSTTHLLKTISDQPNNILYISFVPRPPAPSNPSFSSLRTNIDPKKDVIFLRSPPSHPGFISSLATLVRWLDAEIIANLEELAIEFGVWREDCSMGVLGNALGRFGNLKKLWVVGEATSSASGASLRSWFLEQAEVDNDIANLEAAGWVAPNDDEFVADRVALVAGIEEYSKQK